MAKASSDAVPRASINPKFFLRAAGSTPGIDWFVVEALRNCFLHGRATRVDLTHGLRLKTDREPVFMILDNGMGMDGEKRELAGNQLTWSSGNIGNGTGLRQTAATLAQKLEIYTVSADEPDRVYYIHLPIIEFIVKFFAGNWQGKWSHASRAQTIFPQTMCDGTPLSSGTLVVLADFRATEARDLTKTRGTANLVTVEAIKNVLVALPPDDASRCYLNKERIKPRPLDGFVLCAQKPTEWGSIGMVDFDIRFSETSDAGGFVSLDRSSTEKTRKGNRLFLGGATATVPMQNFIDDCRTNPELWGRIPESFRNARIVGYLRMGILEGFSTPDRHHILSEFYVGPHAVPVIDALVRIEKLINEGMVRYNRMPRSEITQGLIHDFVLRVNAAQGIGGKSVPGGDDTHSIDPEKQAPVAPIESLVLNTTQLRLEPWSGKGERDSARVEVKNPLPGERFFWDDQGIRNLVTQTTVGGPVATICAVTKPAGYIVVVRSQLHPERRQNIDVAVRERAGSGDIQKPVQPDQFSLVPAFAMVPVMEDRQIAIRFQGKAQPPFRWTVEPATIEGQPVAEMTVTPEGRRVAFRPLLHGRFTVICHAANSGLFAKSTIEATGSARPRPDVHLPEDDRTVCGGGGKGTGGEDRVRPSEVVGETLSLLHEGVVYHFQLTCDPIITDAFMVDHENRRIIIGDRLLLSFPDVETRNRHLVSCVTDAIFCIWSVAGILAEGDRMALIRLTTRLLDYWLKREGTGTGKEK